MLVRFPCRLQENVLLLGFQMQDRIVMWSISQVCLTSGGVLFRVVVFERTSMWWKSGFLYI